MNHDQFATGITELKQTYGDRIYPDARVKRIWEWARKVNADIYTKVIEEAIGSCDRPPLLPKLKEIYSEIKIKNPGVRAFPECNYCADGWVLSGEFPGIKAYRCRCDAGQAMPSYVIEWNGPMVRINPTQAEINWRGVNVIREIVTGAIKKMGEG